MPQSHQSSFTPSSLNAKQRKHKLISWLCSTTFIVSPVLADAFDFRVELDGGDQVLYVERIDQAHLRQNSPEGASRKGGFRLNDFTSKRKIDHDGLTLEIYKDEVGAKIRVKLSKGKESLGFFDVKDDGTVHVSTQATSDHLFITSTKDIYLEGHTSKGMHNCNLTLHTDADVHLKGTIVVQSLYIRANRIISRDEATTIDARNVCINAKHLETLGTYRCYSADIDLENDWENKAQFYVEACLSVRARSLRNRKIIRANQLNVRSLVQFDNSDPGGGVPHFIIHEAVTLAGISSFLNKGNVVFDQGADIQATDSIFAGTMTVKSGNVKLNAPRIDIESLVNNGNDTNTKIDIIADGLVSKQILAPAGKVIFNVAQKATLEGLHAARDLGFKGGEVEHSGRLEASARVLFSKVKKFTHKSGEITAHEVKGTVTQFENKGLIHVSKYFGIQGEDFNNTSVIYGVELSFLVRNLNNSGDILALDADLARDDVKANLKAVKKRDDLSGLALGKILIGGGENDKASSVNNTGRIISGAMSLVGASFTNNVGAAVFIYDDVSLSNPKLITSPGVLDSGKLHVMDEKLEGWPEAPDPLTIEGNIQTQTLSVKLDRALSLNGKLVVLNESSAEVTATTLTLSGELAWVGKLDVTANTVMIDPTSKFQFALTKSAASVLDIDLAANSLINQGKLVVSNLTLTKPAMVVENHGTMHAAIHAPVVLGRVTNQKDAVLSLQNAAQLNVKEYFYSYGKLEFKENTVLKVCEGVGAAQNAEGSWDANVWLAGTVVAKKGLTLHTPVFAFIGNSIIRGTLSVVGEIGFFENGEHGIHAVSGSVERFLKISKDVVVKLTKDLELQRGKLIDDGTLKAGAIRVKDGRVESTGKLHATTLEVAFLQQTLPMIKVVERVEEDGDRITSSKKELSVTTAEIPAQDVIEYKAKKQKEIDDYNRPREQRIRFEKKLINSDIYEVTEYVEEHDYASRRYKILSTVTKRMSFLESLTYERQRQKEIDAINDSLRRRKKRTITFSEHKVFDVRLEGDTKVSTATINVPCIKLRKAQFNQGTLRGTDVVLGSNMVGSLTVIAATAHILDKSDLQVDDVGFHIAKSMTAGAGSKVRGIGGEDFSAKKISVRLSNGSAFANSGKVVGETVEIGGAVSALGGRVENSGKIHAGTLSLSNLESFKNTTSTAEVSAKTTHLNGVNITDAPIVITEPYTAKPGEDLSCFKFLSTLTIDASKGDYTLQKVTAKRIQINGSSIKIGAGVCTECLEITSKHMIFFEAGVTFDQIGQVIVHSGDVTVKGKINIAQITAKVNQFVVEPGAYVTCVHLDLIGVNGLSLLNNKGAITTTRLFTTNTLRINNEVTGIITMQHSFTKDLNENTPNFITNNGTINIIGDVRLMRAGCSGERGSFNVGGKFSLSYGDNTSIQLGTVKADSLDIAVSTGTLSGGFSARQVSVTAREIQVTQATQIAEKIKFITSKLTVAALVKASETEVVGSSADSMVLVTESGDISTQKNIALSNIRTLDNKGKIATKEDLVLSGIAKIIQNGILASENKVIISGRALTELISDFAHTTKKAILGKSVTIDCKLVKNISIFSIESANLSALETLDMAFVESSGSITLTAAQKICVSKLKSGDGITFSAAKLIHIGASVEAEGDIVIPAGGELELNYTIPSNLTSGRSIVIKRKLKPGAVNAVISGNVVEWDLAGLTQLEQDDFLIGGGRYKALEYLRVKTSNLFRLILSHPVRLTTLPNFLMDSNLEFRTSSFVSSHRVEYPHSLKLNGLTTSLFNDGKILTVKGRLDVISTVDQEITGVVDTGRGWAFNKAIKVKPGAQLSVKEGRGNCSAYDIVIDQAKVFAGNLTVAAGIKVDEGYLHVDGNLSANELSNVYRGNKAQKAVIMVGGNVTVANTFRNEWLNPADTWHGDDATLIFIGGTLTVGTAGGCVATFLNKCGRVYVNGKIEFNGQKFENLVGFITHRGLSAHLFVMGAYYYNNPQFFEQSSFSITPDMYYFQCDPRLKSLVTLGPGKTLGERNWRRGATDIDAIDTTEIVRISVEKYTVRENNLGKYLWSHEWRSEFSFNIPGRFTCEVFPRNTKYGGLEEIPLFGFLLLPDNRRVHVRYEIDHDEPIHDKNTSVVGIGGITVNRIVVRDGSSNTTSFVNQGMLSGSTLDVKAHKVITTVSSGDETPLAQSKGAMTLTPHGVRVDLPAYTPAALSRAMAQSVGSTVQIVATFSTRVMNASQTERVVELDDDASEMNVPEISSEEIATLDSDETFYGLLGQTPNALDVWVTLQVSPTTQAILHAFDPRVIGIRGDYPGGSFRLSHSIIANYRIFQQFVMSCSINVVHEDSFNTTEEFLRASHAVSMHLSKYGDLSHLPADLARYIRAEPIRQAAVAYAVRRSAGVPATTEQAIAYLQERQMAAEDGDDTTKAGIGLSEFDVEKIANEYGGSVIVFVPETLSDGTVKFRPQVYLPEKYKDEVVAPIPSIEADEVNMTAEELMETKGIIPAAKTLRLTANTHMTLAGRITAGQDVYITIEMGDLDIGPYWDNTEWRASLIGGKERLVIIVKQGHANIEPGSIFDGKEIIIQCWARLYLSPSVSLEWMSKTEACGWFGWNRKTTDYQHAHYLERITLLNAESATILESTGNDVDVSGLCLVQTLFGETLQGPITVLAAKNIIADALTTELLSHAESKLFGLITYETTDERKQALKETRLHSIPNIVTLEKVLNNRDVMAALLAEMLGVATEAHKKVLKENADVKALKRATVTLKAKGMVKGKGASLAGAFVQLAAGKTIAMNEAISESTTDTSGWTPNFGVIGQAISAIINDCCKDTQKAIAEADPSEVDKVMADHMGGVMSVLVDVVQDMMKQRFEGELKKATETKKSEPTKDEVIEALKAAATPLIDVLSLNAISVYKSLEDFWAMAHSKHDYKLLGTAVGAANVLMQACKMADLIEAVCVNGLEKVWEKGLESLENMVSIGISFYNSHVTRKTPLKGNIQALFGLKMRAETLLLNGSDANAMVMDLNTRRVEVGAVCYETDSKDTSGGAGVSLGKTLSVHGEWVTHERRTYVPTRQTAQFMRFGTPGHPVDELVIHGSQLIGKMGTGTIRKLILVDKADTHKQNGASWNVSASLKNFAKAGWDAISSLGFGVKGGDSSKVAGGKAEFSCPGVEVLDTIRITPEEYDRRYGINATKHFTPEGETAPAFAPAVSGNLELGEDSVGLEIPNVMIPGQRTETTSQQITRRDAERAAAEAARKAEEAKRAAEAEQERKKRQQAVVDAMMADAERITGAAIAKEKAAAEAAAAAQKAAEGDIEIPSGAVIPGMAVTNPIDAMRALMTDPKTTQKVADRVKVREAKLRQAQEADNLSDHQVHRLRQGLDDLDRLTAAVRRIYTDAQRKDYPTDVALLLTSGVAVKEGFKYLVRQTARELVDTYSEVRENSSGVVPLAETCVDGWLHGLGVATKYGLVALTPIENVENWDEYNANAANADALMGAVGQLTHYGLSSALTVAGVDAPEADKIGMFILKAMAVRGMIPGVRSVGGRLTSTIESIVRDYEVVYNPLVYSSGGFGSLTVRRRLRSEAPLDAPTAPQARAADIQAMVENYFPGERVTASTVLRDGAYGSKTALVQFKLGDKIVLEIPYCDRGFPIYDAVRKFEVSLPKEIWQKATREPHMKASTIKVREALESGAITESHLGDWVVESYALKGEILTASELATKVRLMKAHIIAGESTIGEFTWHHHQEFGRMELIPEWIHDSSKHTGGYSLSQSSMK